MKFINITKLGFLLAFIYVCFALFPNNTYAHAYIVNSNPKENEILSEAPTQISIQFNEPIQSGFHSLTIIDSSGKQTKLKAGIDNISTLQAKITHKMVNGTYAIKWKVVSADGHPVQGIIPFGVGTLQNDSVMLLGKTSSYIPKYDMILLRWLLYSSFAIYLGITAFNLWIYRGKLKEKSILNTKRWIWISLIGMTISLLLNLPLQTKINADGSWKDAFHFSLLKETLNQTTFGVIWIIQIPILLLLFIFTYLAIKRKQFTTFKNWLVPFILMVGLLITKSLMGHAFASSHKLMAVSMNFLHLLAASLWVGSLFALIFIMPRKNTIKDSKDKKDEYWRTIQRFSILAMSCVAIILLTGIYEGFEYVPTFYSLTHTAYGKALISKIILFFIMLLLGAFHFWKGKKRGGKNITATVGIEFTIGLIVVIVAGFLTNLPPAASTPGPFNQTKKLDHGYVANLKVSPNQEGMNSFTLHLEKDGKPVSKIEQISLTFSHLDMDMGENSTNMTLHSPGEFQTKGMFLSMSGKWDIKVHILTKSLDSFDVHFQPEVGSQ